MSTVFKTLHIKCILMAEPYLTTPFNIIIINFSYLGKFFIF